MAAATTEDMLRENIDSGVKAVVKIEEKWMAMCSVDSSSAYTETYFRETNDDDVDGGTGSAIRGISPLAPFPYVDVTETEFSSPVQKYAAEALMSMESIADLTIPMLQRKVYRIGRKIIYQQDSAIQSLVASDFGNTVAIGVDDEWDSATIANRDPVKNFLDAMQTLRADGIDFLAGNGKIVLNGQDYTNVISNGKILNHPTFTSVSAVQNGVVAGLVGGDIIVSEIVPADTAYLLVAKQGMVWKQKQALTTSLVVTPGKSTLASAWTRGCFQLQAPNEVCKLTNTRA